MKQSNEGEKIIQTFFYREELPKGHILFRQGETCNTVYFIEHGFARIYYFSESGREITAEFFSEKSSVTAKDSFFLHKPTIYNCELMEDCVIYSISYSELESLIDKNHEFSKFVIRVILKFAKDMTEYIANLKFQTAEERYNTLITNNPTILQHVSLGHIASYLGITQETLSRIRAGK